MLILCSGVCLGYIDVGADGDSGYGGGVDGGVDDDGGDGDYGGNGGGDGGDDDAGRLEVLGAM